MNKIMNKKVFAIFFAAVMFAGAFAVMDAGSGSGTSVNIAPQSTANLNYIAEPNGTYLWNGHYLRSPPVAYPKVPNTAPDGLPYGAIGPVGAQGHIGPYTFTRGTPSIVGVSPATTAGTNTTINTNTYWNNETLTLVGNVSILSNVKLYINDSVITFNEPSSNVSYDYGFKLGAGTSNELIIQDGSIINQTSSTTRGLSITGGITDVQNSTLLLPSPYYPGYPAFASTKSCIVLSYFNYSTVNSFFDNSSIVVVGSYPNINSVSHSSFVNSSVQINTNNWNNLSFEDSLITRTAASTHLSISYVTSSNVTDAKWHLPGGVGWNSINGQEPYNYSLSHDLFNNDNISGMSSSNSFFAPGDPSLHNNATISNVTITNMYAGTTVGGGFFGSSGGLNFTVSHLSVINFTLYHGSTNTGILGAGDNNVNYTTHFYLNDSLVKGATMHRGSEGGLFGPSGVTVEGYYGDMFQNLTSLDPYKPLSTNGPFGNADDGIQLYGSMAATKSANSVQNPSVPLTWHNLNPGQQYSIEMYNGGNLLSTYSSSAGNNGTLTFEYEPAYMPLDPTFALSPISSGQNAAPGPHSGGLFIIGNIPIFPIVMVAGIIGIIGIAVLSIDKRNKYKRR